TGIPQNGRRRWHSAPPPFMLARQTLPVWQGKASPQRDIDELHENAMSEPITRSSRLSETHDVLRAARDWIGKDGRVALATVVGTWGSAPVPVGGQLVIGEDGRFEGSVSGGCVEGEGIAEAEDTFASGARKRLTFGVADETAWQVGLPCGGQIKVFLERLEGNSGLQLIDRAMDARSSRRGLLVRTQLRDGRHELFERGDDRADALVREHLESGE